MRLLRLKSEQGMVLPSALGILAVLSISAMVVLDSSGSSGRQSTRSKADKVAFALAEAGINNAVAVLSKTGNNNMSQGLLPQCSSPESSWRVNDGGNPPVAYEGGEARWCATLDLPSAVWHLTARGYVANAHGTKLIMRELKASVPIEPIYSAPLENNAWNYMFATRTGTAGGCDLTFSNNVTIGSNVYAMGNLCLDQNVKITAPKVIVKGKIDVENNAAIGASTSMSTRVETQVGGYDGQYCRYAGGAWTTAASNPFCGDAQKVFSRNAAGTAATVSSTPEPITPPVVDWNGWYNNAIPGPKFPCTYATTAGATTIAPPVWDNNLTRDASTNGSVTTVFDLTPVGKSYECRVGPASGPLAQIKWDHTADSGRGKLTINGTFFIDGSLKMTDSGVKEYDGYATIYLSGTFLMSNNSGTKLCARLNDARDNCDYTNWDPNTELISIAAGGNGSLSGHGSQTGSTAEGGPNSILLNNSSRFQGAMYAVHAIQLSNNSQVDGPMIGSTIVVDNNVVPDAFPNISTVPSGMPGNSAVFAQTQSPNLFSG